MQKVQLLAALVVAWPIHFAQAETLQNDGFVSGGPAVFQGGFVSGEIAAARFELPAGCPCLLTGVTALFGGSSQTRSMGLRVWDDPGGGTVPGNELFSGSVTLTGSDVAFQEIDLAQTPVLVSGPFRVGLEFNHDGLPSVATDLDGSIDAAANFILADVGVLFWFSSQTLGVSGDFIIRATVEVFGETDGDGVPDAVDNCVNAPNVDQRDTDGDGFGNICDPDLNNDCVVNPTDLGLFKAVFFTGDEDADLDGDGAVNPIDLGILKNYFFGAPGPSGLTSTCP